MVVLPSGVSHWHFICHSNNEAFRTFSQQTLAELDQGTGWLLTFFWLSLEAHYHITILYFARSIHSTKSLNKWCTFIASSLPKWYYFCACRWANLWICLKTNEGMKVWIWVWSWKRMQSYRFFENNQSHFTTIVRLRVACIFQKPFCLSLLLWLLQLRQPNSLHFLEDKRKTELLLAWLNES